MLLQSINKLQVVYTRDGKRIENCIARFFPKKITSKYAKESISIITSQNLIKKYAIISSFDIVAVGFLFCHNETRTKSKINTGIES